jgi:hypothetical protein
MEIFYWLGQLGDALVLAVWLFVALVAFKSAGMAPGARRIGIGAALMIAGESMRIALSLGGWITVSFEENVNTSLLAGPWMVYAEGLAWLIASIGKLILAVGVVRVIHELREHGTRSLVGWPPTPWMGAGPAPTMPPMTETSTSPGAGFDPSPSFGPGPSPPPAKRP